MPLSGVELRPPAPAAPPPVAARRRPAAGRRGTLALAAAGALALVGASLLVRTSDVGTGFWIDEGLSVGIAERPLLEIPGVLRQDGSPPLYYLLVHVWMALAGRSETALHVLSLLWATATVPLAGVLAWRLFGARAGWIAAVLAAFNPFLTQYAQEARMYTMVAALGVVATAASVAVFALRRPGAGWRIALVASLVLALYTHNWALFFGAAVGLGWLVLVGLAAPAERRALLRDGLVCFGATALLYLPWAPFLLYQAAHTGAPWARRPPSEAILQAFGRLLGAQAQYLLLLAGGAGLVALRRGAGRGRLRASPEARAALLLAILAVGTLVAAWLSSQASPAWALRYLAVALPPLLLLAALGLARAGALGLAALAVVALLWAGDGPPGEKSNVRSIARTIAPALAPGDLVVSTQPEQIPVLAYYLGDGLRYATLWGPVRDLGVTDWRDGVQRLERTSAPRDLAPLVARLEPGQKLVLVEPIVFDRGRWSAPWTRLIRLRSLEWQQWLSNQPRLQATSVRPVHFVPPRPNPVRATVYTVRPLG